MTDNDSPKLRLRFFGIEDYGSFFQVENAYRLLRSFDGARSDYSVNDVVELHHVTQFAEFDLFPATVTDEERSTLKKQIPELRKVIGQFFLRVDNSNFCAVIRDIDFRYRADVLQLLARKGAYKRCTDRVVLAALQSARISIGDILTCEKLVCTYDQEIRRLLLAAPDNAEHLIAKYLKADVSREINLPASFTPDDSQSLIAAYIESSSPNPNFLKLIVDARVDRGSGIDASLKLKAKHAYDAYWRKHFEANEGILSRCKVRISNKQTDAVVETLDGLTAKYSYSRDWLVESLDYPTILNNFIYLFDFTNAHMLLNFPSFHEQLSVFERFMITTGRHNYQTGIAFAVTNQAAILQTIMYEQFLRSQGVELESVLAWFFSEYIANEFGADNFKLRTSSPAATYLERTRHLFSEIDSVLKQFTLYVEYGRLDRELLAMTSLPVLYRKIPSLVQGKYVYATEAPEMQRIQRLLFSDQSLMGYIREDLHEATLTELILKHDVHSGEFADYQKPDIDFLITCDVIKDDRGRSLSFASVPQVSVLKSLNDFEAASFFHYSPTTRNLLEAMERKGWIKRCGSLLTEAESKYFNFMLNQSEFSNGPDLRNRYLHGTQADGDDNHIHYQTYIQALRLLVALVIKINDDFEICCQQSKTVSKPSE